VSFEIKLNPHFKADVMKAAQEKLSKAVAPASYMLCKRRAHMPLIMTQFELLSFASVNVRDDKSPSRANNLGRWKEQNIEEICRDESPQCLGMSFVH
jgi:hypothetical protein